MQITIISVRYEIQVELGNRERATLGASATAELEAGEDQIAAHAALFEHCKRAAGVAAMPLLAKRSEQADSVWAGLPAHIRQKYEGQY
jgi:hypothetical protein